MRPWLLLFGLAAALAPGPAAGPAAAEPLVFAATSTARAVDAVLAAWGGKALASYAPSGTLARQIEAGAPADVFLSANPDWMDHVEALGLIRGDSRLDLLTNTLVLIGPAESPPLPLDARAIGERLQGEPFAMADPDRAPIGQYGRAALVSLGLWDGLAKALVPTQNTVATVAVVARGEAGLGLVFASDAQGIAAVTIVARLPSAAHPPIRMPIAALTTGTSTASADALLAFLEGPEAQAIFQAHGFGLTEPVP